MDKHSKKHIEQIIKEASLEKAPKDFTQRIMQDVTILSNDIELQDAKLSSLLKQHLIESPSLSFTQNTTEAIEISNEFSYEPIISKRAWYLVTSVVLGVLVYFFMNNNTSNEVSVFSKITAYTEQFSFNNFSYNVNISSVLVFSLVALSSLLLLDYFVKQRSYL